MARARGPVGWTCPKIDSVIRAIESAINSGDVDELQDCIAILEGIRSDNDALREWGAEQEDLANGRESEIESLTQKIESLTDDVSNLEKELETALASIED